MDRKAVTILLSAALLASVIWTVHSAITFQQTANVTTSGSVTYYLDGAAWSSGDIAWGDIDPGETLYKALNVSNGKNTAITPVLTAALPSGWTQTWTLNNTQVAANTDVAGTLSLTAPSDALAGPVSFNSQITP